jgi:hypothetical protein
VTSHVGQPLRLSYVDMSASPPTSDVWLRRSELTLRAISGSQSPYSITSSAATNMLWGTVRPSVLAVFKLITSSNLVGT